MGLVPVGVQVRRKTEKVDWDIGRAALTVSHVSLQIRWLVRFDLRTGYVLSYIQSSTGISRCESTNYSLAKFRRLRLPAHISSR